MGGITIKMSEAPQFLRCLLESTHFSVPYVAKSSGLFLYTTYNRLRMVHNCHEQAVYFDVNDGKASNTTDSLRHRSNVSFVSLFYRYCDRFCWSKIRELIPVSYVCSYNTQSIWCSKNCQSWQLCIQHKWCEKATYCTCLKIYMKQNIKQNRKK